jgi:hypothetical protein
LPEKPSDHGGLLGDLVFHEVLVGATLDVLERRLEPHAFGGMGHLALSSSQVIWLASTTTSSSRRTHNDDSVVRNPCPDRTAVFENSTAL